MVTKRQSNDLKSYSGCCTSSVNSPACAAPCLSDCACATANPTERNASSFGSLELAAALQGQQPSAEDYKLAKAWPKHTLRQSNSARA